MGIFFLIVVVFFAPLLLTTSVHAQTPAVQKAFDSIKERVDNLVVAKDTDNPRELTIRIETFTKVIDLSETEAKELKMQLLQLELSDKTLQAWKTVMLDQINGAIAYYDSQQKVMEEGNADITMESIKSTAETFKLWREENYIPTAEEIYNVLIIFQEREAIDVAQVRSQKVSADITKLQKARVRGIEALPVLLVEAKKFITKADELNSAAYDLFLEALTLPPVETMQQNTTSTATGTIEGKNITLKTIQKTTTTIDESATTSVAILPSSQPSIKDLVRSSLVNIRDAYQVFIEMGNVVRALFS